uniref:U1-type domain-containing protein n=1 Tax=Stegastes partitus TaxID=144197 RepID=A0A3B4Z877_9TELE
MFLDLVGGSRRTWREPTLHGENVQTPRRKILVPPPGRKLFPDLHKRGGKLFCVPCNTVVEHKRKSSIDKHFSTVKHRRRMAETNQPQTRQITVTEAVASTSVASTERMKVSYIK